MQEGLSASISTTLPAKVVDSPETSLLIIEEGIDSSYLDLFKCIEAELANSKIISSRNIPIILTKSGLIVIGATAGYSFFNAAKNFSQTAFLSWYLGLSVVVSNSGLIIWSFLDLVDNIRRNINNTANQSDKKSLKKNLVKILRWFFLLSFGMLSALPSTYIAYKFNEGNLFWPSISFIADSAINSYSLSRLFGNFNAPCSKNDIKNKKAFCLKIFQEAIDHFISLDKKDRYLLLQSKGLLSNGKLVVKDKIVELISELIFLSESFKKTSKCSSNYDIQNKTMKTIGKILSLSWITVAFSLAYDGSKILYDHPAFNVTIALLSVTPASLLEIDYSSRVYESLSLYTNSIINRRPLKSASTIFFPKLNPLLNIIALLITSFSFGARAEIAQDYFSGVLANFLIIMIILTTVSYKSYSMPRLIDELLIWVASFYNDSVDADTLKLITKIAEVPASIDGLSDSQFILFYSKNENLLKPTPTNEKQKKTTTKNKFSIKDCLPQLFLSKNTSSSKYDKLEERNESDFTPVI